MSRPFVLDPLFRRITTLPGIGPRNGALFEKLIGGEKILNLLQHLPVDFVDRRFSPAIKDMPNGKIVTVQVTIEKHSPSARRGQPYKILCQDGTGRLTLVFFKANKEWMNKILPIGEEVVISGKVEYFQGNPQIAHPDVVKPEERDQLEAVEPIYPLTQGISNKLVGKAMKGALELLPDLPEWIDPAHLKKQGWARWQDAMQAVHEPESEDDLSPHTKTRERLAYDELLANQLTLALVRHKQKRLHGRSFAGDNSLRDKVLEALPFSLTGAQERSLAEIYADMKEPGRMLRLLQGDVGAGKTVVALLAMLNAVECGAQAALMAPTEILARQHAETLRPFLDAIGVRYVILTGRDKGKARAALLQQIESGEAQIVMGTHALFQDDVLYKDLGLAVVDEQHRFGVQQRLLLAAKSKGVDVLVMTATPIPRTLALTGFGDMDISRLDEKPPGRKPVDTRLIAFDHMPEMVEGLKRQVEKGARVYWVCPLVEESELVDLAAAEERFDIIKEHFGGRAGLVHGRMKAAEKDDVMQRFAAGDLDVLVATTVIEVGVNVPEATIMVIEHAERFGLAQLHQLRGRVGRGGDQSYCFLLYHAPLSEAGKERLRVMRETEDGFVIAEKDLELRGFGDILGVRQSGMLDFKLADLAAHGDLLAAARDDAKLIIASDPDLKGKRGDALRTLLYLFERDQAVQFFRSG